VFLEFKPTTPAGDQELYSDEETKRLNIKFKLDNKDDSDEAVCHFLDVSYQYKVFFKIIALN
jgi:hypothetical protein